MSRSHLGREVDTATAEGVVDADLCFRNDVRRRVDDPRERGRFDALLPDSRRAVVMENMDILLACWIVIAGLTIGLVLGDDDE